MGKVAYLLLRFSHMRILKYKSQLTIAFFAAANHLNGPFRKQNFTLMGSKGHGLWFVIGGFRSFLRVSVFQGSLLVIVIMNDASGKRNCEGGFWTLEFACLWKRSKFYRFFSTPFWSYWPCCCCRVSSLVNSIKDQTDKRANLGILVASISDICEENARGVRSRKCLK